MRLHTIFVQGNPEYKDPPFPFDCWSEYDVDGNYEGFLEKIAEAKKTYPNQEVRIIILNLPDKVLDKAFDPITFDVEKATVHGEDS